MYPNKRTHEIFFSSYIFAKVSKGDFSMLESSDNFIQSMELPNIISNRTFHCHKKNCYDHFENQNKRTGP